MSAARNYSSTAARATLTAPVDNLSTLIQVDTTQGWPAVPFTAVLDKDRVAEEIVTVTNVAGLNITITRAADGSTAVAHPAGGSVIHSVTGRDFSEAGNHVGDLAQHGTATPGADITGLTTPAPVSVSAGPTTIVAGPSSGRRVVKSILLSGPSGATVTLTLAGVTLWSGKFTSADLKVIDCCIVIANGENLQATVTSGPVVCTSSYADRSTLDILRLGLSGGTTSGTAISAGTARTITEVWIGNQSATNGATFVLLKGGTAITPSLSLTAGNLVTLDSPIQLSASESLTWTGDGSHAITVMASGY